MNNFDLQYQALLTDVLQNGTPCSSRGLYYSQKFGQVTTIDLREGFPLTTLRKMPWATIIDESLFDISGSSQLADMGRAAKWWEYLADESGNIDYTYGNSWRHTWGDQLNWVIDELSYNATSRAIVLQTYDPAKRGKVKCSPCHTQLIFSSDGKHLDMMVTGRSSDIPRYALIQSIIASYVQLEARQLCMPCANNHIYENNAGHTLELISRIPLALPQLSIVPDISPFNITSAHIQLLNYNSHDLLKPNFN